MSNSKISALTAATTPLAGTELVPLVQSGVTKQVTVANLAVTSVGLAMPTQFAVTGSPVTTTGTLTAAWNTQTANTVLAGPTTGAAAAPTFRSLVAGDIPALSYVTSVGATAPITSTGGLTPTIGVTAAALTKTDDTNVTLTLGGSPTTALLAATSLTLGWTGTLSPARGGTGVDNSTRTLTINTNSGTLAFTNASTTLTIANTGSISGTNTGDVTLATNSGLAFTSGQTGLALGTPSNVTSSSTNSVTTNTHTHAVTPSLDFIGNGTAQNQIPVTGATPFAPAWTSISSISGQIDHNSLTNLTTGDVHTQYAFLAGRVGNQTLIGGTASAGTLTLQSTANATRGKILFGTSAYDEANNRLGVGTTSPSATLDVATGNLTFSSTSQRITGDMANTTEANRLMFQNSVTNGNTNLGIAPNGTATTGAVRVYGVSDVANSIVGQLSAIGTSEVRLNSTKTGTASFAPLTFYTNGSERMRIDSSGRVGIGDTAITTSRLFIGGLHPSSFNQTQALRISGVFPATTTSEAISVLSRPSTATAIYTLSSLVHFYANPDTFGAGSTVSNQYGFVAESTLTAATNNFGFYSNIASGANRWNFYANGTAANYFAGEVRVGNTSNLGGSMSVWNGLYIGANNSTAELQIYRASTDTGGVNTYFNKARGTIASPTVVSNGDTIGDVSWRAYDGAAYQAAARITAAVDGTPGAGDMPGRLTFLTTPDGTATAQERMRITNAGDVGIGTTSPGGKTEIRSNSSGNVVTALVLSNPALNAAGTGADLRFYVNDGREDRYAAVRSVQAASGNVADLRFLTANSDVPAERARVKHTGQVRFVPLASDPAGAESGDVYYNSGTNKLRVYNGTSWVDLH